MQGFFPYLIAVLMLGVLGVLVAGLVSMVKGGKFNKKHGNKLMQWRVMLQAAALILLAIMAMTAK